MKRRISILFLIIVSAGINRSAGGFMMSFQRSEKTPADKTWIAPYLTIIANKRGMNVEDIGVPDVTRPGWYGGRYGIWEQEIQAELGRADGWWDTDGAAGLRRFCYLGECDLDEILLLTYPDGRIYSIGYQNHDVITNALNNPAFRLNSHWISHREWYSNPQWSSYLTPADYGLIPFVNPDGMPVDSEEFYHALARRNISDESVDGVTTAALTDEQAERLGLNEISEKHSGEWIIRKDKGRMDFGNPQVLELLKADIGSMVQRLSLRETNSFPGIDGVHLDGLNHALTLFSPDQMSFGLWTRYNFNQWLQERFSPAELSAFGVTNIITFDMREYIVNAGGYNNSEWNTNLLWQCYKIAFLEQRGEMMKTLRGFIDETAAAVQPELAVSGNLIPIWPGAALYKGLLDIPYFEWGARDGFGLNTNNFPFAGGRYGFIGRLAAKVAETDYAWASIYVDDNQYKNLPELHKLIAFNFLPHRLISDWNYSMTGNRHSPGTTNSFRFITQFIKQMNSLNLLAGAPAADIGIVFDPWCEVASLTVGSRYVEPFTHEYSGWCDYLEDRFLQWDVILNNGHLSIDELNKYQAVILPSYSTISSQSVAAVKMYLQNGGRVIMTGSTGGRFSTDGFLMPRSENIFAGFSHAGLIQTSNTPGKNYRTNSKELSARNEMDSLISAAGVVPAVSVSSSVNAGINVYQDSSRLMVNIANYGGYDLAADSVSPATNTTITVQLPDEFLNKELSVSYVYAGMPVPVIPVELPSSRPAPGQLSFETPAVKYFQIVIIKPEENL